jgi:hypothetical protein
MLAASFHAAASIVAAASILAAANILAAASIGPYERCPKINRAFSP